jgi:PhnB protein
MTEQGSAALSAPGHSTVNPFIIVKDSATAFISFLEDVFGATERSEFRTPDRDGSLIHAEVSIGDATIMIADSKRDWPFTPAFTQVYVADAQAVLDRAQSFGARIITPLSPFYNGVQLARFQDPWGNLWWLYEPDPGQPCRTSSNTSWHDADPSLVYTSLMSAMRDLGATR